MRVPNFIVGTSSGNIAMVSAAIFEKIAADERKGELLIEGFSHPIISTAAHPELQMCAIMQSNGVVSLVDLDDRTVRSRVSFSGSISASILEYDVRGRYLIIGGCDSQLLVCSAATMHVEQRCRVGKEKNEDKAVKVIKVAFAPDGSHFAAACDDHSVSIFRFERNINDEGKEVNWLHLGRAITHRAPIVGLQFADDITKPSGQSLRLFSIGSDRLLSEYDLANSTVVGGVKVLFVAPIEETARPTSFVILPQFLQRKVRSRGIVIVVANNEYKFKVIDPDKLCGIHTDVSRLVDGTSACLNTFLGPVSAGPPCSLSLLPCGQSDKSFLTYACPNKVAGLLWLPLDGNPHRGTGIIAHPGEIVAACSSADGKLLVTSGGTDFCVCLWGVDTAAAAAAASLGGSGMDPVWSAIDGGIDGEFAEEIRDFFVYAQIRRQGEDTRDERLCVGWVRPDDVPDLFCALGSYLSQFEVKAVLLRVESSSSCRALLTLLPGARAADGDGS
jgi:WD40 repeat protein